MNIYLIIIIYLLGVISSYYTIRYYWKKNFSNWGWDDIMMTFITSLGSWVSFLSFFITISMDKLDNIRSKPPKWL